LGIFHLQYSQNREELINKSRNEILNSFTEKRGSVFNSLIENYSSKYIRTNHTKKWNDFYNKVNRDDGERLYTIGIKQKQHQRILREIDQNQKNSLLNRLTKKPIFL
jgi:hypothetical protein